MVRRLGWIALACVGACAVDPGGLPPEDGGTECSGRTECDDSIDCTENLCIDGACVVTAMDARCAGGEVCVEGVGCRPLGTCDPDECAEALRDPTTCEVGACSDVEGTCVGETVCAEGESCCGDGSCQDCDDGNPCTEDRCDDGGCVSVPLTDTPCDDGDFCNGVDVCDAGACMHAGNPCEGTTRCDGTRCVGCIDESDCPAPIMPAFGACESADVCSLSGTQTRMVTTFACVANECVGTTTPEEQACKRDTDGETCGLTMATGWSVCGDFSDTCDEVGTQSQMVTARECVSGACEVVMRTNVRDCMRDTDGTTCADLEIAMGDCEAMIGSTVCSQSGQRRVTTTMFLCADGACAMSPSDSMEACFLDTDDQPCDPSNICAGLCADGSCDSGATEGDSCDDGLGCTGGDTCNSGTCEGSDGCRAIDGDCGFCLGRCDCVASGGGGSCQCL